MSGMHRCLSWVCRCGYYTYISGLPWLLPRLSSSVRRALVTSQMSVIANSAAVVVIVSAPIATAAGNAQNPWLEAIEERLASTVQALGSVKAIKATGLTQHVHSVITALRIAEIAKSRRYRILDALLNAGCTPLLSTVISNC